MPGRWTTIRDYLVYLAVRVGEMFVRMFDYRAAYRLAGMLGNLWFRLIPRHRRRAVEHLRRSFPDWDDRRLEATARASLRSLAYLVLESVFTTRRITPGSWRRHIILKDLGPGIRILLERRGGLVFVAGHFGNWEVIGYTIAVLGFPSVAVARPLDNPFLNEHLMGVRERAGQSILYKRGATQSMQDVLEARGTLSFIADQDAGKKGVFVDFLGRPASTYKSVALMAMQHGAPVAVGYGRRIAESYRFEMGIERVIEPREWAGRDDPLRWITQEFTSALERVVRRSPEQYVWTHRRWKTRPGGEPAGPDGVA